MSRAPGTVDRERLEALLGGDDLAWLRSRVRARLEAGQHPTGTATLRDPAPRQRDAADRLLGRKPTSGSSLTVPLDEVDETLRRAGICDGLATAVTALDGPVEDRRAHAQARATAWETVLDDAARRLPDERWATGWLDDLRASGLLRRLAASPEEGRVLVHAATAVLGSLPAGGVGRERFAAAVLGDSHGLDDDRPVATLVLRALQRRREGTGGPLPTGEARRALWASVGVLRSELARPALVLNLPARGTGLTDRLLRLGHRGREPLRLTLRQLVRHPPDLGSLRGRPVYVCENPAVVAATADALPERGEPLVCVEGQPASAVRTLLGQLRDAGAELLYHGDFDWAGLRIARLVLDRFGARPWRYRADDYDHAPAGPPLGGEPVASPWDPMLAVRMEDRGVAVHEEQVLASLLEDLSR